MDWFLVTIFTCLVLGICGRLYYIFVYLKNNCANKKATDRVQDWVYTGGACLANNCVTGFKGDQCEMTINCPDGCQTDKCSSDKKTCSGCSPGYGSNLNGDTDDNGQCPEYWFMKSDVSYSGDPTDDTKFPKTTVPNDDACISNCTGVPNCAFAVTKQASGGGVDCYIKTKFGDYNGTDKGSHLLLRFTDKNKLPSLIL
jgi:hypothetical protein